MKVISSAHHKISGTVLAIALLAGCASAVTSPISETNKDPNGTFDGQWKANVLKSPATQYLPGNWRLSCSGKPWDFAFRVDDSLASIDYRQTKHFAYVDKAGRFRFEVPMNNNSTASGTSDISITRGERTMIINGSLKNTSGRITFGVAEFANQGCSAKVAYSK